MGIRIISKNDGFRRCGMAHSSDPQIYPDDKFTAEEIEVLKAEPMLTVEEDITDEEVEKTIDGSPVKDEDIDFEAMTKAQLKEYLAAEIEINEELGQKIKNMTKGALIELCKDVVEDKDRS